ncbi:hypothetical protein D9613_007184 [Agrocybe pediades]|uniref:F-box domain-containing protein n=1 Tax=Agrocybe pediades TaxID=84607 RepID=A0A8H4VII4_9AGAR|nr:hypothetical protein D9613_007184 [Agrocybe pediades]
MSLPQELCDLIIDETSMVTNKTERSRDLVALSLVCKSFRNRAHKHLFESVNLIHQLEERKTKTARHLLSLFEVDPCTETSGLASRISSFTCCFFSPGEDSECLIGVLRTLFNNPDNTKSHPTPCSLSLISATSMRWSELGDNLLQELSQVCHRPRLASLSIFGFQDFPLHFLRNMSIKRLFISSTSVLRPLPSVFSAAIGDTGRDRGVILETLDLDHLEPPPGPLLVISEQTNPSVIFSNLKTLRYSLYDHMQDALKQILTDCANQLEVLEVTVLQRPAVQDPIPFEKLPRLRKFCANISLTSFLPVGFLLPLLDQKEFCPALQTITSLLFIKASLFNPNVGASKCDGLSTPINDAISVSGAPFLVRVESFEPDFTLMFHNPSSSITFKSQSLANGTGKPISLETLVNFANRGRIVQQPMCFFGDVTLRSDSLAMHSFSSLPHIFKTSTQLTNTATSNWNNTYDLTPVASHTTTRQSILLRTLNCVVHSVASHDDKANAEALQSGIVTGIVNPNGHILWRGWADVDTHGLRHPRAHSLSRLDNEPNLVILHFPSQRCGHRRGGRHRGKVDSESALTESRLEDTSAKREEEIEGERPQRSTLRTLGS